MLAFKTHKTFHTRSPQELVEVVEELKNLFKPRTILLLEGPVGAGKTELVKALTKSMGLPATASPSFAIHHRYENTDHSVSLDHVDLYRLKDEDDLESTGFWDLFALAKGLVVIEWAERLDEDLLPLNWAKIKVKIQLTADPSERHLSVFTL